MLEPWQVELVEEERVATLGTIAADGRPHLVPACFALVGEEIVIAMDEKPKRPGEMARFRNIARDARVSLLVHRYDDDWARLAWVRLEGSAAVIARGEERPAALAALRARYPRYRAMALEALPLIAIAVDRVVSWRWQEGG